VAILAGFTALIGFALITNRDLDESAIGLPGVPPEYDDECAPIPSGREPSTAG